MKLEPKKWSNYKISDLLHVHALMETLNYLIYRHDTGTNYQHEIMSYIRQVKEK